jgi:hypothetical protein
MLTSCAQPFRLDHLDVWGNGSMKIKRLLLALSLGLAVAGTTVLADLAMPAYAQHDDHDANCNSGGGNGSEFNGLFDCDPGNSGGNNNGKD